MPGGRRENVEDGIGRKHRSAPGGARRICRFRPRPANSAEGQRDGVNVPRCRARIRRAHARRRTSLPCPDRRSPRVRGTARRPAARCGRDRRWQPSCLPPIAGKLRARCPRLPPHVRSCQLSCETLPWWPPVATAVPAAAAETASKHTPDGRCATAGCTRRVKKSDERQDPVHERA